MKRLLKYFQHKLGKSKDFTDFMCWANKRGIKLWNEDVNIVIPWEEIPNHIKKLYFKLCDEFKIISFNH